MEYRLDQARRNADVRGDTNLLPLLRHDAALRGLGGTRAGSRNVRSPTLTSIWRVAAAWGSAQRSGWRLAESSRRAVGAPVSVTHTCEFPNRPRPLPRPGPGHQLDQGVLTDRPGESAHET